MPGTNPSQIPEPPAEDSGIGAVLPSPFQSPITETAFAFGAQTANCVPVRLPTAAGWAPSFSASR